MSETDPESETVRATVADRPVVETVARAVAEARDVDVLDLPPLGDAVDAEALARLCRRSGPRSSTDVLVSFAYAGCRVSIDDGETVSVSRVDRARD
jgi:hypothetical protein